MILKETDNIKAIKSYIKENNLDIKSTLQHALLPAKDIHLLYASNETFVEAIKAKSK